ncbi:MAG: hypothetical protein AAB264_03375, partial [Planctomycetota bacterium]
VPLMFSRADKIKKLAIFIVFAKLSSYGKKQFLIIFNDLPESLMILFKPAKIAAFQKISGVSG